MASEAPRSAGSAGREGNGAVHVQLPADDPEKLVKFYSDVFGWQFGASPGTETYRMVKPERDGAAYAIFPRQTDPQRANYIDVASVNEHASRVAAAGGNVVHRFSVPRFGHGAICVDPEGNPIALWQQDPTATESPS